MQVDVILIRKEAQMSMWNQWKRKRDINEGLGDGANPVDNFKFNDGGDDYAADYEQIQKELFSIVLSKYPEETMQFLDGIAQRGDEEVLSLLRKLQQESPSNDSEGNRPRNPPEVVPSAADSGHGGDEDGGDQ